MTYTEEKAIYNRAIDDIINLILDRKSNSNNIDCGPR